MENPFRTTQSIQYVVGTVASDSNLTAPSVTKPTIIVGGPRGNTVYGTASGDDLIDGGAGSNTIFAGGGNDIIFGGSNNGNNVLNGNQNSGFSGQDVLISGAGNGAAGSKSGQDVQNAGYGNNIMIDEGITTTFNIDVTENPNAVDVVWATGTNDAINIKGVSQVFVVDAPNATLASVENLDLQKLDDQITKLTENHLAFANPVPPFSDEATVIVINPSQSTTLTMDGTIVTGDVYGKFAEGNFANVYDTDFTVGPDNLNFVVVGGDDPGDWIVGLSSKDFGITDSDPLPDAGFIANTPTINLLNDQVQSSGNATGGSGGGTDPSVVNQATISLEGVSDTLLTITAASALGVDDTLIAANGADTLTASGYNDTLIGNIAGSTLISSGTASATAAYTLSGATVDLGAGTVSVAGNSASDTLIGISAATALGNNQTLIGGSGSDTLVALGTGNSLVGGSGTTTLVENAPNGNTLIAGSGTTVVAYATSYTAKPVAPMDVNLTTGTATVAGSTAVDHLVGIHNVTLAANNSTLTGSSGFDSLTVGGNDDVLVAGSGSEILSSNGVDDTLIAGSGYAALNSTGDYNTLIAGSGIDSLTSTGYEDTLIGNGLGSVLFAAPGNYAIAAYELNKVVVNLAAGTAGVSGSTTADQLSSNIVIAEALGTGDTLLGSSGNTSLIAGGSGDTLIGGSGTTSLFSNVGGNTLMAGSGQAIAVYTAAGTVVDLATDSAKVSGSSSADTLIGITTAEANGGGITLLGGLPSDTLIAEGDDTLIAGSGTEVLSSSKGLYDTLFAGSGRDTLSTSGLWDVLVAGNGAVETLSSTNSYDTLVAGSGSDTLTSSGSSDILTGGSGPTVLSSSGSANSLVAGSGRNTLTTTGSADTLFGNGGGSTLIATTGTGAIAAYSGNDVLVNVAAGTAAVNASSVNDTLLGFGIFAALGSGDTLIDGNAGSTLFSSAGGNTLEGGTGQTVAAYAVSDVTADLATGSVAVNGSNVSDTLIGIHNVFVSGAGDVVTGDAGADVLSSTGTGNTLIAGTGADNLVSSGIGNTLIAGADADSVVSSGTNDVLRAGTGNGVLTSTGTDNSLIAGTGIGTLSTTGQGDTLFGNCGGSTLEAGTGSGAIAAYTANDVTVNLATGKAGVNGTSTSDTLIGFTTAAALGSNDTLIDGNNGFTLFSNAEGNTLEGGTGRTVAAYAANDLTLDLATGIAGVSGSSHSDTLIGIHAASVSGTGDTLIGDSGSDLLSSSGTNSSLIAGSGVDTLLSTGTGDVLFGNLQGSTLELGAAAYSADNVTIDLDTGTASATGSDLRDKLISITTAEALGSNDTLIDNENINSTLISDAAGNTLMTGPGYAAAMYEAANVTVNLITGTASISSSGASDTLIGVTTAIVAGVNDTIVSSGTGNLLVATNTSDVASFAASNLSVDAGAGTAGINGSNAEDTLTGFSRVTVSGSHDSVLGGPIAGSYEANGSFDTLISGVSADTLVASGADDTLVGNVSGSTLEAAPTSVAATALYTYDGVTVDLAAGTASSAGSTATDSLIGIDAASVSGSYGTLIGGAGADVLSSTGTFNSLVGGTGANTLRSSGQNDTLLAGAGSQTLISQGSSNDLVAGTGADLLITSGSGDLLTGNLDGSTLESISGSGAFAVYGGQGVTLDLANDTVHNASASSDTIIGINNGAVTGAGDVVLGGSGSNILSSDGSGNTLIAGSGTETLLSNGSGDTLTGGSGADILASSGSRNSLVAGSGVDTLESAGVYDVLIGTTASDVLQSSGSTNTLVAGSGVETLSSTGTDDTLFGNAAGSTLDGTGGTNVVAGYTANDVTVSLAAHTATSNGSSVSDSLVNISSVIAAGVGDTLIGGTGASTLYSSGQGNTLEAGTGATTVVYAADNLMVDLATSSAQVNGSSTHDTLVGITNVIAAGSGDTVIGGAGGDVLTLAGSSSTAVAGSGTDTLVSTGQDNTLVAGSGSGTLASSGSDDTLLGGSGASVLSSSGSGNSLVAGSGTNTLSTTGETDTLFGNSGGSTLEAGAGSGGIAAYMANDVTVNLATGKAEVNGTSTSDTLIGFTTAAALGSNDTLIDGNTGSTLFSNAGGNTLEGGTGQTVAAYAVGNVTVDLATGTAAINGSSVSDTLVGIHNVLVAGTSDVVTGDAGTDLLSSSGIGNTLIAGSGADSLTSNGENDVLRAGTGSDVLTSMGTNNSLIAGAGIGTLSTTGQSDTLFGNGGGSTLEASAGSGGIAAYTVNDVTVNLGTGKAGVNGASTSDTLIGFTTAAALGSGDTLIDGNSGSTLFSNASGNTLEGGTGQTVAAYIANDVTVELAPGTAAVSGSSASDKLVGIHSVFVSGTGDVVTGDAGADVLQSNGIGDTLTAGSGVDTLSSTGQNNTLIASTASDTLVSSGFDDTLIGNGLGITLDGSNGYGAVAAYSLNGMTIDLATGVATVSGSSVSDTLVGISSALALGKGDTLIGGSDTTTLASDVAGNTLVAGSAQTVAAYAANDVSVDLATGTAAVNGSSVSDTLVGIHGALVTGTSDVVTGDAGADVLSSSGIGNTLIAGSSADTLVSSGVDDTLYGNALGSTLDAAGAVNAEVAYAANNLTINLQTDTARVNGAGVSDTLLGFSQAAVRGSNDTLVAGLGNETLLGGGGATTYVFDKGYGQDTIVNGISTQNTAEGTLDFDSGIADTNVWLDRVDSTGVVSATGADLRLTLLGTQNTVTINDWFTAGDTFADLNAIHLQDSGLSLTASVNSLVATMATFEANYAASHGGVVFDPTTSANATITDPTVLSAIRSGWQGLNYQNAPGGVTVDLATDTDSFGNAFPGVTSVVGSPFDDTFIMGSTPVNVVGNGGNDRIEYLDATAAVTADLATGTDSLGNTFSGISSIVGSSYNDVLTGGSGNDMFDGGAGNNTIDGGSGTNTLTYATDTAAVIVNVGLSQVGNGYGGLDTFANIQTVIGSAFNDTFIVGRNSMNLAGGGGNDEVGYAYATAGVTVDLANGSDNLGDTFSGMKTFIGSTYDDTFMVGAGGQTLEGNAGADTISYALESSGVTVNLTGGEYTDSLGDVFHDFQSIVGSSGNDTFILGSTPVSIVGGGGNDRIEYLDATAAVTANLATGADSLGNTFSGISSIVGSSYNDVLTGGTGNDTFDGGAGNNTIDGGSGTNTLTYAADTAAVIVNVGLSQIGNGYGGLDTFANIQTVIGSAFNDTFIVGRNSMNLVGGGGNDEVGYAYATAGVTVDLANGTDNLGDTFSGMKTFIGSTYDDTFMVGAGGQTLEGNVGTDTISYALESSGVTVNLTGGEYTDSLGDVFHDFQSIVGSSGNDTFILGSTPVSISAGGGNDLFEASAATMNATIDGGTGQSTLEVTGGGSITMGSNITRIADVLLGSAGSPYYLTANGIAMMVVDDLSGGADTLGAGGANQVLTGGGAGLLTMLGNGSTTMRDASAVINGDTLGFNPGDTIDVTDIIPSSSKFSHVFSENASNTAGTLTLNDGTHSAAINILGNPNPALFSYATDGHSGVNVTFAR